MHEVSLVHALFDEVDRHAAAHPGGRVREVRVRIGAAAGVDPGLFETAFAFTKDERGHPVAALRVVEEPERWACGDCGSAIPAGGPLSCACGGAPRLVSGDALVLDHLSLEVP
jgi:Zn finger protein HypA/HybF involved in hydrogenase expression